jgi:hypothetical protein
MTCNVQTLLNNAKGFDQLSEFQLLALKTSSLCNWLNNPTEPPMQSHTIPLNTLVAAPVNFAHGLGGVPNYVALKLLCTAPDATLNAVVGDEFTFEAANGIDLADSMVEIGCKADATKIYASWSGDLFLIVDPTTALQNAAWNSANFSLKIYYNKF